MQLFVTSPSHRAFVRIDISTLPRCLRRVKERAGGREYLVSPLEDRGAHRPGYAHDDRPCAFVSHSAPCAEGSVGLVTAQLHQPSPADVRRVLTWELKKGRRELQVRVEGQLTFNGTYPILAAALDGFALAVPEDLAKPYVEAGRLEWILEAWFPTLPGTTCITPAGGNPRRRSAWSSRPCAIPEVLLADNPDAYRLWVATVGGRHQSSRVTAIRKQSLGPLRPIAPVRKTTPKAEVRYSGGPSNGRFVSPWANWKYRPFPVFRAAYETLRYW